MEQQQGREGSDERVTTLDTSEVSEVSGELQVQARLGDDAGCTDVKDVFDELLSFIQD